MAFKVQGVRVLEKRSCRCAFGRRSLTPLNEHQERGSKGIKADEKDARAILLGVRRVEALVAHPQKSSSLLVHPFNPP